VERVRIVAGEWGGRTLASPGGKVRPTQDRVRQVLFDILGARVQEGWVLDLYSGSGALGLEALSRGAPCAVLVEAHPRTLAVLKRNCEQLGASPRARVLGLPVSRALGLLEAEKASFRWIVADPPYGDPGGVELLWRIGEESCSLLGSGAGFVLESRSTEVFPDHPGRLRLYRTRVIGDTSLHFYEREYPTPEGEDGLGKGEACS
jgi:16S rRNA (guanine966-N2)-methyltransferase